MALNDEKQKGETKKTIKIVIFTVIITLTIVGCLCLVILLLPSLSSEITPLPQSPEPSKTEAFHTLEPIPEALTGTTDLTPAETATSTFIPVEPTKTKSKTSTPHATSEPLTCRTIENQTAGITEYQWETYLPTVLGAEMLFSGQVLEVTRDGTVAIIDATCQDWLTIVYLHDVPVEIYSSLKIRQYIQGTGMIMELSDIIGLSIYLNVKTINGETVN